MKQAYKDFMLLNSLAIIVILPFVFMFAFLPLKAAVNIDLIDIVSELSLFILAVCWIFVIRSARPKGGVTNFLIVGLCFYTFGCYLDLLDEVFIRSNATVLTDLIEKAPMPIGLCILTIGLWQWRAEQKIVNRQLQSREQYIRQHHHTDNLTLINDTRTFESHIKQLQKNQKEFGLIGFDATNFSGFNAKHGIVAADKYLENLANHFCHFLRGCDLVCRYAGDRFIIVIEDNNDVLIESIANSLSCKVGSTEIKCRHSVITASEVKLITTLESPDVVLIEALITEINERLSRPHIQIVSHGETV